MSYDLGIIGAGNMAEAIVRGLLRSGRAPASGIIAADPAAARRDVFANFKTAVTDDNAAAARDARTVLLSVKPQQMESALAAIGAAAGPGTLFISIAAGISAAFIEKHLGPRAQWRVVRAMPNTPMLLGEGVAAICPGKYATPADLAAARAIFESAAVVIETDEANMDAVTAVSGSGPAYYFYLTEQIIRAAIELGLSPDAARLLAVRTAVGSAKMLAESGLDAAELRKRVTSPGGTTQAAITHLESQKWAEAMVAAVKAAAQRGAELSK